MNNPRARELGIPFDGTPGNWNAITDVPGVEVGHVTLISCTGVGAVRTGVTAIRPRSQSFDEVFAAWYALNGCGEMTGTIWMDESGFLYGPILLTNTYSVGVVKDAVIAWMLHHYGGPFGMPVVAETYDGYLNDIAGFHVTAEHAWQAMDNTASGPVSEGNVGGGTGMICHGFKGGIGTASRILGEADGGYTLGVLVQANHGRRERLTIAGIPCGKLIPDLLPEPGNTGDGAKNSSIIVVLATDCPLLPHQLRRLAKRIPLGIGRLGGLGEHSSGDIFLAFSTVPFGAPDSHGVRRADMFPNEGMNPLFAAAVQATEEAILNALVTAETMQGYNGNTVHAIPHDRLQAWFTPTPSPAADA